MGYVGLITFAELVGFGESVVRTWDGTRPANGRSVILVADKEGDDEEDDDVGVDVYAEERPRGVSAGNRL